MSPGVTGESWQCPHCGETILRSAIACPACNRRLRFDAASLVASAGQSACPLAIESTIRHPEGNAAEYSLLVEVHDDRGELLARRVVGVGGLKSGDVRKVTVRFEVQVPEKVSPPSAS
ncbi:MAG TPA: hypothetical protein VMD08_10700 [Candidatus Baltobacteraceae bacterium]|nr:hypothetical protein [Candidatus Baltobacteraceae bacterium]